MSKTKELQPLIWLDDAGGITEEMFKELGAFGTAVIRVQGSVTDDEVKRTLCGPMGRIIR